MNGLRALEADHERVKSIAGWEAVIHLLGNLGHALMREYWRSRRLVCSLVGRWQGLWGRRNAQKSLWTALPQAARGWSAYSGYPLDDL